MTFENVQAGLRYDYLFRLANHRGGIVVGTGDLSELALGWCTYGVGDQMSHYNVNAGVPKTLMVNSDEIREALQEPVNAIVDAVRSVLERTPPELSADIVDRGIVLSGGPSSVYDAGAPTISPALFDLGVPILGICYGAQLTAQLLGGDVEPSSARIVWAVCATGMMAGASRSTDGGVTFEPLHAPPLVNAARLANDADVDELAVLADRHVVRMRGQRDVAGHLERLGIDDLERAVGFVGDVDGLAVRRRARTVPGLDAVISPTTLLVAGSIRLTLSPALLVWMIRTLC